MKVLNLNEIGRTAFLNGDGTCPYCKNKHTDTVLDPAYLEPFKSFYKEKKFRVVNCYCCSAVFSICQSKEFEQMEPQP